MAFTPQRYGLVDAPPIDPMRSLSDLMQLGRQMEASKDESQERARVKRVETALNAGKGNPDAAATALEQQGDWVSARSLRDQSLKIRTDAVDGVMGRLNEHKTIYGQGAQLMTEVRQRPDLYPQLRPKLVELASALDPKLAAEIPEAYDPARVDGMLQFIQGGAMDVDTRQRALTLAKATMTQVKDSAEAETSFRRVVGDWLSTTKSAEEWQQGKDHAAFLGVPASVITEFGDWDAKAPARAREKAMTPGERATDARATVDDQRADLNAQATEEYRRVQESIARQREARLDRQNSTNLSATGKATAERWKANALDALESEAASTDPYKTLTPDVVRRRQLAIENSYRAQLQLPPLKDLPKEWSAAEPDASGAPAWVPPPPATRTAQPPAPAAPKAPSAAGFKKQAGADGRVTVTAPDGTTATFPSAAEADAAITAFLGSQ